MTEADGLKTEAPTPVRRPWWKRVALGLLVLVLLAGGYVLLVWFLADRSWRQAVAEADRLDPGWRFDELEARRAVLPDEDNAARCVLAAQALLPKPWPPWLATPSAAHAALDKSLTDLSPTAPLNLQQVESLTAAVEAARPALAEARRLIELPSGRYPITYEHGRVPHSLPQIQAARQVGTLLSFDILLRERAQDLDGALDSCRGYLNAARSFGDEPDSISQVVRLEMRSAACRKIERALAQGQPSAASLAALQRLLEGEEKQPVFLHGARGFRAWMDRILEVLQDGDIPLPGTGRWGAVGLARSSRPIMLRVATRLVEMAKLPVEEQAQALEEGLPKAEEIQFLARIYLYPKLQKATVDLSSGQLRSQAELRCAVVALAAERYRQSQGAWPAAPAVLVPRFVPAVPVDPFDGQPLRYRRTDTGIVVYCLGPDGTDDGGKIDPAKPRGPGTDLGFRLWDVPHRAPESRPLAGPQ